MSLRKFLNGLLYYASLIVVFLFSIYIVWNIVDFFKPYLIEIATKELDADTKFAKDFFSWTSRIFDTIVSLIITAIVKIKIDERQSYPYILIEPRQTRSKGISGVKKDTNLLHSPRIIIGEKKAEYRIIYTTITNIGKVEISKCHINEQPLLSLLASHEVKNFVFILYDSFDETYEKEYILPYKLWDVKGRKYSGLYRMKVNINNCTVIFNTYKKLRRVYVKNALSDL